MGIIIIELFPKHVFFNKRSGPVCFKKNLPISFNILEQLSSPVYPDFRETAVNKTIIIWDYEQELLSSATKGCQFKRHPD